MFIAGDTETVTRIRPPGRDKFGDPTGAADTDVDLPGCLVAPGGSSEAPPNQGANTVEIAYTVYAPDGSAEVLATDQLRVRGEVYQVVGRPQQWTGEGTVIALRRTTG